MQNYILAKYIPGTYNNDKKYVHFINHNKHIVYLYLLNCLLCGLGLFAIFPYVCQISLCFICHDLLHIIKHT